jgi:cardiolipin synthase
LSSGNAIELLIDARANFDAWLEAIRSAQRHVLLDNYMVRDDDVGRAFLDALHDCAQRGVRVCVIRDWLGCLGQSRDGFWHPLREAGGEVRCFNPPRLDSPFGWISRDHRKMLAVDSRAGFLSGVCISGKWLGDAARGIAPWRDTGVALRGPAVADLENAFADAWDDLGEPLDAALLAKGEDIADAGAVDLRIIATRPQTAGVYRLDQLIAGMARESLWLTDAYFVGVAPYVQALAAAARDGVDVRLLVPGASDVPVVAAMSRSGYRPLLEAGVRVFEWQGSMLHAKTAVADGRWARVGSSNLNLASWIGNCELDVAVENVDFAHAMQQQYLRDLENATEVVLSRRAQRAAAKREARHYRGGSSGRAAAGAMRLARSVGSALGNRRVLGADEFGVLLGAGSVLLLLAALAAWWPKVLAWPLAAIMAWLAASLLWRVARQRLRAAHARKEAPPEPSND